MSDVLEILALDVDADGLCTVDAVVDNIVVLYPASRLDPAECRPALCRGTFYISDDEVIPVDEQSQREYVADSVLYWNVLDTSDEADFD